MRSIPKVEIATERDCFSQHEALPAEQRAARKVITTVMERSQRAFAHLFSALPDDLQLQVAHLSDGWAYGLWAWLEAKFQSTEDDNIDALLTEWAALAQDKQESFDAYRARVNRVQMLLTHAEEKPSARVYSFTLLGKLQPHFKPAVLALKNGELLRDAKNVDWEAVTRFINAHERSEQRLEGAGAEGQPGADRALAATQQQRSKTADGAAAGGRGASASSGGWQQARGRRGGRSQRQERGANGGGGGGHSGSDSEHGPRCYECGKIGHIGRDCPLRRSARSAPGGARTQSPTSSDGGDERANAATRWFNEDHEDSSDDERAERGVPKVQQRAYTARLVREVQWSDVAAGKKPSERVMGAAAAASAAPKEKEKAKPAVTPAAKPAVVPAVEKAKPADVPAAKPPAAPIAKPAAAPAVVAKPAAAQASPPKRKAAQFGVGGSLDDALNKGTWGLDTMASVHVSGNKAAFGTLGKAPEIKIKVADGGIVSAAQCGSVPLRLSADGDRTCKAVFDSVYYNERFDANLLSWGRLYHQNWELRSSKAKGSYLLAPKGQKIPVSMRGKVMTLSTVNAERVYNAMQETATRDEEGPLMRLHTLLGHMGVDKLIRMLKQRPIHGLPKLSAKEIDTGREEVLACKACALMKSRRTNFGHRGLDRGSKPGEVLHLDTFFIQRTQDGRKWTEYGVTMSCGHSEYKWFAEAQRKYEIPRLVLDMLRHARTQLDCRTKRVYIDGGSEFLNSTVEDYCARHGMELHPAPPATPQLDGIAERWGQTLKSMGLTLLKHGNVPARFWAAAMAHASFVWNRSHVAKETGRVPMEVMRRQSPSIKHWGVFGCDVWMHVLKKHRADSFSERAEAGIYLGHDAQYNCAKVWSLRQGKIVHSRDVVYRHLTFTHASALKAGGDALQDALHSSPPTDHEISVREDDGEHEEKADDSTAEASEPEYIVEEITAQRRFRGKPQYKVRWAGYDEETWEPLEHVEDTEALERFQQKQAPPRSSPRLAQLASEADPDESADDGDADAEPQVHMVMSALRSMQSADEPLQAHEEQAIFAAVASGVAGVQQAVHHTPKTHAEAMRGPNAQEWEASERREVDACIAQKVWTLVRRDQLPSGTNVLSTKWVYRTKLTAAGAIDKRKSRITPRGFEQKKGVDYNEVFAHTGSYKAYRLFLSLTARWDYELVQMDVPEAFLNPELQEDVYMELPVGYEKPGYVVKLNKALYGLKQAPREWDILVHSFMLKKAVWQATTSDRSLYFRRSKAGRLMLVFRFVDDFQGSRAKEDAAEFGEFVQQLRTRFNIKVLPSADMFLGMRLTRDRELRTIKLDQAQYIETALVRYGMENCKPADTPEAAGNTDADEEASAPCDRQRYMEITGTMMYAAHAARPDIAHAAYRLACHMQAPTERDMIAAKRVLRYLAGTKEVGLLFGARSYAGGTQGGHSRGHAKQLVDVCAYADADWANSKADRKSITGWVAKLNGDPVSWASKKQRVVALSTCEAELYAEAAAIQEVLWLRGLLGELGLHVQTGSTVHGDNQSTLVISKNGVKTERTKHVDVKYRFVTETVERGDVQLQWVPTAQQQADIFTKALGAQLFVRFRKELMSE